MLRGLAETLLPHPGGKRIDIDKEGRWRGHRTFIMDGSSCSMSDTPDLQRHFGQPGNQRPGCGFPVAHLLVLFHAGTGLLREILTSPLRTHDMSQVPQLHPALQPGDIGMGDRGFCSYAHLALLSLRGASVSSASINKGRSTSSSLSPPTATRPLPATGGCPVGCTAWGPETTWSSESSPRRSPSG